MLIVKLFQKLAWFLSGSVYIVLFRLNPGWREAGASLLQPWHQRTLGCSKFSAEDPSQKWCCAASLLAYAFPYAKWFLSTPEFSCACEDGEAGGCAGTSPWERNTWKSNCKQEVAELCFAWCTVLGTTWLPRQVCASDLHLQGAFLCLAQPHTEHILAWKDLHSQTCINTVPDFDEMPSPCARAPQSQWWQPMQHNGTWASVTNLQVQMKIAHLGTGIANFPGRCDWISYQKRAY